MKVIARVVVPIAIVGLNQLGLASAADYVIGVGEFPGAVRLVVKTESAVILYLVQDYCCCSRQYLPYASNHDKRT